MLNNIQRESNIIVHVLHKCHGKVLCKQNQKNLTSMFKLLGASVPSSKINCLSLRCFPVVSSFTWLTTCSHIIDLIVISKADVFDKRELATLVAGVLMEAFHRMEVFTETYCKTYIRTKHFSRNKFFYNTCTSLRMYFIYSVISRSIT